MKKRVVILNEVELRKTLSRLTFEIIEKVKNLENLLLVGIPTRGIDLAEVLENNSFSSTSVSSIPLVGIPTNSRLSSFFTFSIISEVKREIVFLSSTSLSITIFFVFLDMIYQKIKVVSIFHKLAKANYVKYKLLKSYV